MDPLTFINQGKARTQNSTQIRGSSKSGVNQFVRSGMNTAGQNTQQVPMQPRVQVSTPQVQQNQQNKGFLSNLFGRLKQDVAPINNKLAPVANAIENNPVTKVLAPGLAIGNAVADSAKHPMQIPQQLLDQVLNAQHTAAPSPAQVNPQTHQLTPEFYKKTGTQAAQFQPQNLPKQAAAAIPAALIPLQFGTGDIAPSLLSGAGGSIAQSFAAGNKPSDLVKAGLEGAVIGGGTAALGKLPGLISDVKSLPETKNSATATALQTLTHPTNSAEKIKPLVEKAPVPKPVDQQIIDASKPKDLPVKSLTTYEKPLDNQIIEDKAAAIQKGERPVITVVRDSAGNLGVEDGKHALAAYKQLGFHEVPTKEVTKSTGISNDDLAPKVLSKTQTLINNANSIHGERTQKALADLGITRDKDGLITLYRGDDKALGPIPGGSYLTNNPKLASQYGAVSKIRVKPSEIISSGELTNTSGTGHSFNTIVDLHPRGEGVFTAESTIPTSTPQPLTPIGEGVTKTPKLASGVEAKAVEKKLTDTLGDLPQYKQVNMKDQAQFATDLLKSNKDQALRIATGSEAPPSHILPESVFTAVENKALKEGDTETLRQLANSTRVGEATAMGQRLRALAERNPDSAVANIKQVIDARTAAAEKKLGQPVTKTIKTDVNAIKNSTPKVTRQSWSDFVESIKC